MVQLPYFVIKPGSSIFLSRALVWVLLGFFVAQCNPDEGQIPEPVNPLLLDSTPVSYATDVIEVLNNGNCLGCHSNNVRQGDLSLEGYENFKAAASTETLLKAIKHQEGAVPMPLDRPRLNGERIIIIEKWILQGSKEN